MKSRLLRIHLMLPTLFLIVGIVQSVFSQVRNFYVEGNGTQLGVIHSLDQGFSRSGLELLRGSEFNSTDWRLLNDGGTFKIFDGTDNFMNDGDENLRLVPSGTMYLLQGSEANIGSAGGVLLTGDPTSFHLALDQNEILARRGDLAADLFLQAGTTGNTVINQSGGNVAIGDNLAPVKLTVNNGVDATNTDGGYLLLGRESSTNVVLDNNEILARNGSNPANLFLQHATQGNVSIGAVEAETNTKLTIADDGHQIKLTNLDDLTNDWFIGASAPGWNITGKKLVIDDDTNSLNPIMMFDADQEAVSIGSNTIPAGYKLAIDGNMICEEVNVQLSGAWPDYVFDEDYPLPRIEELESTIEELGHLPGVPSAEEIYNNGISIGQMQAILMKKIEELTLYVIELKKENAEMKSVIEALVESTKY